MTRQRTGFAEAVGQPLGRRPRQAVDHEARPSGWQARKRALESSAAMISRSCAGVRLAPLGDHEDAIRLGRHAGGIDDEGAGQLAERDRRAHGRRPVVIGACAPAREADLAVAPGGTSSGAQAPPSRAHSPCTRSGDVSSLRTETAIVVPSTTRISGAGTISGLPCLAEGLDPKRRAAVAFRAPVAGAGAQPDGHHVVRRRCRRRGCCR